MTDTPSKAVFMKDTAAGILVMVLSLFLFYGAWWMIGYANIGYAVLAFLIGRLAWFVSKVGYYMTVGLHVDLSEH